MSSPSSDHQDVFLVNQRYTFVAGLALQTEAECNNEMHTAL
jgi:hypothetical protein